jgi:hypothetical protein
MYNEKIEKLIEAALLDGKITPKEKEVLFKRAEAEGIDLDEFEIVLESRLFEKKQVRTQPSEPTPKPSYNTTGELEKCPACGAITESFTTRCGECGTEFRNIKSSSSVILFLSVLDEVEASRKEEALYNNTQKSTSGGTILLWIFFFPFFFIYWLLKLVNYKKQPASWLNTDTRKKDLIINYPIPVSKEAMLEFLTIFASWIQPLRYSSILLQDSKYKHAWNQVWLQKIEQIHTKASIAMKGDSKSLQQVEDLVAKAQGINTTNRKKISKTLRFMLLSFVAFFIWAAISSSLEQKEAARSLPIIKSAQQWIEQKNYAQAEKLIDSVDGKYKVEIQSKVQLALLTEKLEQLHPMIEEKQFSTLRVEIEKLKWIRNSSKSDYQSEELEKKYYKVFIERKTKLNQQLPVTFQASIENEYTL